MAKVIEKTENKKGYKKTKLGWIPEDWDVINIGDLFSNTQSGLSRKLSDYDIGLPVLRSNNVESGMINWNEIKYWYKQDNQGAKTENYYLDNGDILLNFINSIAQIGKCAIFENKLNRDTIFTTNLMRIKLNKKINSKIFLEHTFTDRYKYFIQAIAKPAVNQASFTSYDYKKYLVPLPPIREQDNIAEILSAWDDGIEVLEKLIEQKEILKNSLAQKYFQRKNNKFPLKQHKLGELFKNRKETNCCDLELLSVCDGLGIVPRSQLNVKDNSNEDKSKYLKVCIGDLAYNTMRMWQGRCGVSSFEGIVSPAYTVCIPKDNIDVDYMYYLFKTPHMIHDFWRYSQGIVDDTLNLKFNNFEVIKVWVPEKETQTKIAKLLKSYDEEIKILNHKLEKLKEQKKGLMQKLLTGQIRVKV